MAFDMMMQDETQGLQPLPKHLRKLRRLLRRSSTGPEAKARIDGILKRISEKQRGNHYPAHANDNFAGVSHRATPATE